MKIVFDGILPTEFSSLRDRSGMKPRSVQASEIALKNTLYMVGIRDQDNLLIAFGRVVGDGATSFVVNDIMVDKKHHRQGYGRQIMQYIDSYLNTVVSESSFTCLVADVPADKLYLQFGFEYHNETESVGMYRPYKKV